jgi:hypothetical protein
MQIAYYIFVAVLNPNNPSELIRVPAVVNGDGELVPADPRYDVRKGHSGNPGKKVPVDLEPTNWLVIGGVGLLVAAFALKSRD